MKSSESIKQLSEAVAKAQSEFRAIGKSGENKFDKYRYADLEDYVRAVRPVLASHGLSLISSVEEVLPLDDRTTKNGGCEHAVRVKLLMRILHVSGEWIEGYAWGEGQDRADKAVYKATTGARKYGLASLLGLATSDDPEGDEQVGNFAEHQNRQGGNGNTVNRQTGEVKEPVREPEATYGDDDKFLVYLGEACESMELDKAGLNKEACTKAKVQRVTDLKPARRKALIEAVMAGKFDHLKLQKA